MIECCTVWKTGTKFYYAFGTRKKKGGRLLVYMCTVKSKDFDKTYYLKLKGELALDGPVLAVCSFINSYLLIAYSGYIHIVKIDSNFRKLVTGALIQGRFDIHKLDSIGSFVIASGNADSVVIYHFDTDSKSFIYCKRLLLELNLVMLS